MGKPIPIDITDLRMPWGLVPDELHHVVYLPRVEKLALGSAHYGERHLQPLTKLRSLDSLEIHSANITPAGVATLGQMTKLRELNLLGTPLPEEGIREICRLTQLRSLVVQFPNEPWGCEHLAALTHLESLRVGPGSYFRPDNLRCLQAFPKLRCFWFQSSIVDNVLQDLEHVPHLRELRLQANQLSDRDLQSIRQMFELEHLTLESNSGNYVTDEGLKVVANFPRLRYLNASSCRRVTDSGLRSLQNLHQLRTLKLRSTQVTAAYLPHLAKLPQLEHLDLEHTAVTFSEVQQLGLESRWKVLKVREKFPAE